MSFDIGLYGRHMAGGKPYVVVVLGAASGIGRAAAVFLSDIGCAVAALDLAMDGLRSLAADKKNISVYGVDALND